MCGVNIKAQLLAVKDFLSEYIKVHDLIFEKQSTLFSFLGSFFKKTDFDSLYSATTDLLSKFKVKQPEFRQLSNVSSNDQDVRNTISCIIEFTEALFDTVKILNQRQAMLMDKGKGIKVPWSQYNAVENEYKESIKKYMEIGGTLNTLSKKFF